MSDLLLTDSKEYWSLREQTALLVFTTREQQYIILNYILPALVLFIQKLYI